MLKFCTLIACIILISTTSCETKKSEKKKDVEANALSGFSLDELNDELKAREARNSEISSDTSALIEGDTLGSNKFQYDTIKPPINIDLTQFSDYTIYQEVYRREKGIYGKDDRREAYMESDPGIQSNTGKVVAFFQRSSLRFNADGSASIINPSSYKRKVGLCDDEPFCLQPSVSYCTGFAISENMIVSAGHCLTDLSPDDIVCVFDYRLTPNGNIVQTIKASDIFFPTSIVKREYDRSTSRDFLVVRVRGQIPQSRIATIDSSAMLPVNLPVYVIGHPQGLPLKVAKNAKIRSNTNPEYFVANLDTYGGNSGSPVFNATNHRVVGIMVRGGQDFVKVGNCKRSKKCPDSGCDGEEVTRIISIFPHVRFN